VNTLKFEFNVSECNGWPSLHFLIDGDLYLDHQFTHTHELVELPIDLLDSDHLLSLDITKKTPKNTIVDNDGTIIKDQLIELKHVYIDDIKLPNFYLYNSVYKFHNQSYEQALVWGCNGTWEWKFATPIITWALDFKIAHREKYDQQSDDNLVTHAVNRAKVSKTLEAVTRLERILHDSDI
jgi:hypothetical protein